jgi:hypothetical protein
MAMTALEVLLALLAAPAADLGPRAGPEEQRQQGENHQHVAFHGSIHLLFASSMA